jgi:hypothetical protein
LSARIGDSRRNRPERYGPAQRPNLATRAGAMSAQIAELVRTGIDPAEVAARVVTAIRDDELYVFTHPEMRAEAAERFAGILAAMDKAAGE